ALPWPNPDDLSALEKEATGLPAVKAAAESAEKRANQWRDLGTKIEMVAKTLAVQPANLPADVEPLRTEHAALTAERSALLSALKADRAAHDRHAAALQAIQAEDRDLANQVETLQTRLAEEKGRQEGHREAIRKAVQALAEVSAGWEA